MFYVYTITYKHYIYIGQTNNKDRRFKEHIKGLTSKKVKPFYDSINHIPDIEKLIQFNVVRICKSKTEAKRYEMFLILERYFNKLELYQKIPAISGR